MTTAFERSTDDLGTQLGALERPQQVAFLVAASQALEPGFEQWRRAADPSPDLVSALQEAWSAAVRFATGADVDLRGPLDAMDRSVVIEEGEQAIAAQDCAICADAALRVALGEFEAADAMWYVLEPLFQAETERMFGVIELGSDESERESDVLATPRAVAALAAVAAALQMLESSPLTPETIDAAARQLRQISSVAGPPEHEGPRE